MPRALILALPLFALLVAGTLVGVGFAVRDTGQGGGQPVAAGSTSPPTEEATSDGRLRPLGSVCQSEVRRPGADEPRRFDESYTKRREVLGITIVGGPGVPDAAFDEAERTLQRVFRSNSLEQPVAEAGAYIIILEAGQGVLDLPEFSCLAGTVNENFYNHVCGVADRADYPVATVNELDLLGDQRGPCRGLNILYHELGHLAQGWAIDHVDYIGIRLLFQAALDAGKYRNTYAGTNSNEYFAEATQAYFLSGDPSGARDREWLARYDPDLYALLARIYGD